MEKIGLKMKVMTISRLENLDPILPIVDIYLLGLERIVWGF